LELGAITGASCYQRSEHPLPTALLWRASFL